MFQKEVGRSTCVSASAMVGRGAGDGAEVGRGGDCNHGHENYLMDHDR